MRTSLSILILLFFFSPGCKVPEGMIATSYDTFELDVQLNYLSSEMVKSLKQENKSKVAIVEFPDLHGDVSEFGKYVAEELTTRLFTTRRFAIVERQLLNQLLAEQSLGLTGLIDATSAAQVGKMLGVDAIVTGTITDLGRNVRINARLIATESAAVFAVSSVTIEKDEQMRIMLGRVRPLPQATATETAGGAETSIPARSLSSTTSEGYFFEVKSCKMLPENKVRIELSVKNLQVNDRELYFYKNNSAMFDNFGNEHEPQFRELANKRESGSPIRHLMIADLPTHMSLDFHLVNSNATSIPRLNLYLWSQGSDYFTASIRNITIVR